MAVRKISDEMVRRLVIAKFACAIAAVFFVMPLPADGASSFWLSRVLTAGLGPVSVTLLFTFVGYELASQIDEEVVHVPGKGRRKNWLPWWKDVVSGVVRSMLVPFYVWTALTVALLFFLDLYRDSGAASVALLGFGFSSPYCRGLGWLYRAGFLFALLSPLVNSLTRKLRFAWPLAAYALFHSWQMCRSTLSPVANDFFTYGFPLYGFVCFSFGLYLRREHLHLSRQPFCVVALLAGIGCWCAVNLPSFPRIPHVAKLAKIVGTPALAYGLWGLVPPRHIPALLKNMTRPLLLAGTVCAAVLSSDALVGVGTWLAYLKTAVAAIGVSFLLAELARWMPRVYLRLFGRHFRVDPSEAGAPRRHHGGDAASAEAANAREVR